MLVKTRGIVVKATRYSETSVVLQILTEQLGLQSYLLNGVRKAKSRYSPSIMQGLHLLDLVVYHQEGKSIQRISDVRNSPAFQDIPFNHQKTSLLLFLNEVIYKSIRQGHQDEALFEFLFQKLLAMDAEKGSMADFHIAFLLELASQLGIAPLEAPEMGEGSAVYFDIRNAHFTGLRPLHPAFAEADLAREFARALSCMGAGTEFISPSASIRRALVELILSYCAWHIDGFGNIRSWDILAEVYK